MRILIIGSGAREHAICWKLNQSNNVKDIFCLPGNAGIAKEFNCVPYGSTVAGVLDYAQILKWTKNNKIDLVIIGPEVPLADGLADMLAENKIKCFGPGAESARFEASKIFAKNFMNTFGVPTAKYHAFDNFIDAKKALNAFSYPLVIKASGLAYGKGVLVARNAEEAGMPLFAMMKEGTLGAAGKSVIIEECLAGKEVSLLCFVDGKTILPMVTSCDHKRVYDNDLGPNTGGMGAYGPDDFLSKKDMNLIYDKVLEPTIYGIGKNGLDYKGVLYFGLMMTSMGPFLLEYNARFGDPETQIILPLLENDLLEVVNACVEGCLDKIKLKWKNKKSLCIVVAAKGYPGKYEKGIELPDLTVLDKARASGRSPLHVFYAGVSRKNNELVSSGGRVFNVVAVEGDIAKARDIVYENLAKLDLKKFHYRKDIGAAAVSSKQCVG